MSLFRESSMKVICSYCRKKLPDKEPFDSDETSHGMCKECYIHFSKQWLGLELGEYLDQFDSAVMAVDQDARIIGANLSMAKMLDMEDRDIFGLLGGEVLECQYAKLPEGCGNTVHCKTCTIRNAITHTLKTGESMRNIPAFLDGAENNNNMIISTVKEDDFVCITVKKIEK